MAIVVFFVILFLGIWFLGLGAAQPIKNNTHYNTGLRDYDTRNEYSYDAERRFEYFSNLSEYEKLKLLSKYCCKDYSNYKIDSWWLSRLDIIVKLTHSKYSAFANYNKHENANITLVLPYRNKRKSKNVTTIINVHNHFYNNSKPTDHKLDAVIDEIVYKYGNKNSAFKNNSVDPDDQEYFNMFKNIN